MKKSFKIQILFAVFICMIVPFHPVRAGDGAHGAGPLSDLVNKARNQVVPLIFKNIDINDPLVLENRRAHDLYAKNRQDILASLDELPRLRQVDYEPVDSVTHVATWIATENRHGASIHYNPKIEIYKKYNQNSEPEIWRVTEAYLHELGHQYGMDEDDAWTFALTLVSAFRSKAQIKDMGIAGTDENYGKGNRVSEECEATVYRVVNAKLLKLGNQFVSEMYQNSVLPYSEIDITVTLDQGDENYCIKGGKVKVQYNGGECSVVHVSVDPGNFDCG
jgi:hypothetical protein